MWSIKPSKAMSPTAGCSVAKLKWVNNKEPLPLLYESTGTDVKPLECLLLMRDVKSRNYLNEVLVA